MSIPGTDCKIGKVEIPQLFDSISTRGFPANIHAFFSWLNPAAHNQPYTASPNHNAFIGTIFAPGAIPRREYFVVLP